MISQSLKFDVPSSSREILSPSELLVLKKDIKQLLLEREAVLVAHYYTDEQIQILAEETDGIVSDSLDMARFSHESDAKTIVVAGVRFMGETAKILNPEKTVLMPDLNANCSLDLGCPADEFYDFCDQHPDRTVVVYANTSAAVKARADWMVTSGSALDVVKRLQEKKEKIIWAPDKHLGDYIKQNTGADMLIWNGSCVVHEEFKATELRDMRKTKPNAKVIAHPESPRGVLEQADFISSTTGLIEYVKTTKSSQIIVATDKGIFPKMLSAAQTKEIILAPTAGKTASCKSCGECPWMAMNDLRKLRAGLKKGEPEIIVPQEITEKAIVPINRLMGFAKAREIRLAGNNDA